MPEPQCSAAAEEVLQNVDARLMPDQYDYLSHPITADKVSLVLKMLPNDKATGIDSLPYEFWKWLSDVGKYCTPEYQTENPFNMIACLTTVFNDIESHGAEPRTGFSDGWLCPLYKKKDCCKIESYHPITLLNRDYKIFTKILSLCLAKTAPDVIYPNQAGFIQGCSIMDQIKLTQMILNYAEAEKLDGAIIALDQEKAYDKIAHDYLWKVLDHFNFPPHFINTVKALYSHAETLVIINGL